MDPTGSGARFGDFGSRFGGADCFFFGLDFRLMDILLEEERSEETLFARITHVEFFRMAS